MAQQSKIRVYELSKELGMSNKDLMGILSREFDVHLKSHSSSIENKVAKDVRAKYLMSTPEAMKAQAEEAAKQERKRREKEAKERKKKEQEAKVEKERLEKEERDRRRREVEERDRARQEEIKRLQEERQKIQRAKEEKERQEQARLEAEERERKEQARKERETIEKAERERLAKMQSSRPAAAKPQQQQNHSQQRPPQRPRPDGGQRPGDRPRQPMQPAAQTGAGHPRRDASGGSASQPRRPDGGDSRNAAATIEQPRTEAVRQVGQAEPPSRRAQERARRRKEQEELEREQRSLGALIKKPGSKGTKGKAKPAPKSSKPEVKEPEPPPEEVTIDHPMTVNELAVLLRIKENEIIKQLFMKGIMVTVNQTLDVEYAQTVARELGITVLKTKTPGEGQEYNAEQVMEKGQKKLDSEKFKNLTGRAPVVSIMGHVDHGKTSLLDAIRETRSNLVDKEAGGITQSIGAYTVNKNDKTIVFLDTPGHEAFTAMRMRGARSTDIAILVVAADDGVMPQTIEAINHAKAAEIPIIIAVNKMDKEGADPEKVLVQLSEHGLTSEDWGGDVLTTKVSAIQKTGIDELLENILLVSELLELKADGTVPGTGVIIEAQLDKRKGPVATALVQNGTMRIGDNIIIGSVGGRVRALIDDRGERVDVAGPSTPVEILGLDSVPNAGDLFQVVESEKEFKQLLSEEKTKERDERLSARARVASGLSTTDDEEQKILNVLIKADTQGSAEAVQSAVAQMGTEEVRVNILHVGTGEISEADVMLASASNAIIIGFNVRQDPKAQLSAENNNIRVFDFDVIYHINETVEKLILGQMSPEIREVESGQAEIRQLFTTGKRTVAGCYVTSGKIIRNAKARVFRGKEEIYYGSLDSLKRFKDDAKEVASGYECGMTFYKFNDIKEGDLIIAYATEEIARTSLN